MGDLAKLMGSKWKEFVEISVECWVILRENHQELLDFAKLAFSFLYPQETVQDFLKDTLLLELPVKDGRAKIKKRLLAAPKKLKTKMKNFIHSVATHSSGKEKEPSPKPPAPSPNNNGLAVAKKKNSNIFSSFLNPKRKSSLSRT